MHIQFLRFSAHGVVSLSKLARDDVAELQALGFRRDDDVAAVEKFGKFLSAMLRQGRVAVKIEKQMLMPLGRGSTGRSALKPLISIV